jgi:hypothetical protein
MDSLWPGGGHYGRESYGRVGKPRSCALPIVCLAYLYRRVGTSAERYRSWESRPLRQRAETGHARATEIEPRPTEWTIAGVAAHTLTDFGAEEEGSIGVAGVLAAALTAAIVVNQA